NANLTPDEIDYLNLHGTGTPQNDAAECEAVYRVFGDKVLVSSTKPLTGHTLGAAGITDALLAILTLCSPVTLPAQLRDSTKIDPQLATVNWVKKATRVAPKRVMSNNFAFGGNNTSLIFGSIQD
ncbi:MAG: beta-ketoacyl-[acyl-carrier-protein] synthase II, partial [Sutterella sp.]